MLREFKIKLTLPDIIKEKIDETPGASAAVSSAPIIGDFYRGITILDVSGGFMILGNAGKAKLATIDREGSMTFLNTPTFW